MNIDPKKFAFYLKNSSLSSEEQKVVIDRLPKLSESEKVELYKGLEKDHKSLGKVIQKASAKRESIQFDFYKDLRQA